VTATNGVGDRRVSRGLTQQQLAEHLGVSRQTVISIENGRHRPSLDLAFDLAEFFEVTIEELFARRS
jgi:putative transcriptional regulator